VVLLSEPAGAASLFSYTYTNNQINELDADTGALLNSYPAPLRPDLFGVAGLGMSQTALYFTSGSPLTSGETPDIYILNPANGAVLGTFPRPAGAAIDGLAFGISRFGPTLFAEDYVSNTIYLFNPATGATYSSYVTLFDAVGGIDFNSVTN